MGPCGVQDFVEAKAASARAADSLYGDETADLRAWLSSYIGRHKDMLDLMSRL